MQTLSILYDVPIPNHIIKTEVDFEAIWEGALLQVSAEADDDRFIFAKMIGGKPVMALFKVDLLTQANEDIVEFLRDVKGSLKP